MITLRITLAFFLLAVCIVLCLTALNIISFESANETLKRTLLIVGSIGGTLSLIFILFSAGKNKTVSTETPNSSTKNSGPQF